MFKKKKKRKQKKENVRIETCDDNRDIKLPTWSIGKNFAKQEEKETHWSRGSLRIGWIDSRALVGTIDDVLIVSRWPTIDATADVPSHRVYRGMDERAGKQKWWAQRMGRGGGRRGGVRGSCTDSAIIRGLEWWNDYIYTPLGLA